MILSRVLGKDGADARTSGRIYVVVVQSVLMYGSDAWATTPHIGRVLVGLHHRVDRRLTGRKPQRGKDGRWVYPPPEESMEEVGLQEVYTYVSIRQNKVAHFIANIPIMEPCLAT